MDKVQKEQQSLKMNRSNVMVHKWETDVHRFTAGSHGCWPRIVQKVSQNVLHTFLFGSFSSSRVWKKNRLDFKTCENEMENGMV